MNLTSGLGAELLLLLPDRCVFWRMMRRRRAGEKWKVSVVGRIEKLPVFCGNCDFLQKFFYCRKLITDWSCCWWKGPNEWSLTSTFLTPNGIFTRISMTDLRGSGPEQSPSPPLTTAKLHPSLQESLGVTVGLLWLQISAWPALPLKNLEHPRAMLIEQNASRQVSEETSHKGGVVSV